jgi:hypothetical protein
LIGKFQIFWLALPGHTSEQRTLSKTQNNHLTGKAPYKFEPGLLQRGGRCELDPTASATCLPEPRALTASEISREEIREMMDRLIGNLRAAAAVFMTEDPRAARQAPRRKGGLSRDRNTHNRRVLRTGARGQLAAVEDGTGDSVDTETVC